MDVVETLEENVYVSRVEGSETFRGAKTVVLQLHVHREEWVYQRRSVREAALPTGIHLNEFWLRRCNVLALEVFEEDMSAASSAAKSITLHYIPIVMHYAANQARSMGNIVDHHMQPKYPVKRRHRQMQVTSNDYLDICGLFAVFTGGGGPSTSGYGNALAKSPMFVNVLGP
jgi:hypothetical protein